MRNFKRAAVVVVFFLGGLGIFFGQTAHQNETAKRLVGTWRLVSDTGDGVEAVRGAHPTGLLIYDMTGHMAVQIMPDRPRPKFVGAEPTPEEAKAAITGYAAYFGTYIVDEKAHTVTHHRVGNIDPSGLGDFVRRYELAANGQLALMPLEGPRRTLTWERVK